MSCLLIADKTFDCASLTQGGIKADIILINQVDWDNATITEDTGVTEEITVIALASGKEGYQYVAPKNTNIIASCVKRAVDGLDGYDHSIDVRVNNIEQLMRIELEKMSFNKVVAIVKLIEGRAEVWGRYVGLRMSELEYIPGDANTGGTIRFMLKTPDADPPEKAMPILIDADFDLSVLIAPATPLH